MKTWLKLTIIMACAAMPALADGLLMPADEAYPKDFLRNRMTRITAQIHGAVAETFVYQEFVNEWHKPTDAVYAFPLPPDARATEFLYWRNDSTFKAVLKEKEQATTPGTGEGGVAALVNRYIGRNGIKIELKGIQPGKIQKVELRYISLCDYYRGEFTYAYPLETSEFITWPLEQLECRFHVWSTAAISGSELEERSGAVVTSPNAHELHLAWAQAKSYATRDVLFRYRIDHREMGSDFYSALDDSGRGHFCLFVRPPATADSSLIWPRRILFLIGNSTNLSGYLLSQTLAAIDQALSLLKPADEFNVMLFNTNVQSWKNQPVAANAANIAAARNYLKTIGTTWGAQAEAGLEAALDQMKDESRSNSILLFSDGRALLDPKTIESRNSHQTAIFPVGLGEAPDRSRLEMLAALNYGFVTYFAETSHIITGMNRLFQLISQPLMQQVRMEYGRADLYDILPVKLPSAYAGSQFFTTGRYRNPGSSGLALGGMTLAGMTAYDFRLDFSADQRTNRFVLSLWAREMIDALESEIDIYGETAALKDSLIALSLGYGIRCRYTAYIADYVTEYPNTGVARPDAARVPRSYLLGNYPNPFNAGTSITFYISDADRLAKEKFIRIYNSLGQLVAVIDISAYGPGLHTIHFDGIDGRGEVLASGFYFVRLQAGTTVHTIKMTILK
jgi:Ca-activated chloride channel family protein